MLDRRSHPAPNPTRAAARAFTLPELLVAIGIIALLIGIAIPAVSAARARAKLTTCATHLREIGTALLAYTVDHGEVFPQGFLPWSMAFAVTRGVHMVPGRADTWVVALQESLGVREPPWLRGLRCPLALDQFPAKLGEVPVGPDYPGSAWYLNAYCSARPVSSIPAPADGVLAFEHGLWSGMSIDTGLLEFPSHRWRYPHPSVHAEHVPGRWNWPRSSFRRNIVWCDGHVSPAAAAKWPNGDLSNDADRIRHMRFGLAGTHWLDP